MNVKFKTKLPSEKELPKGDLPDDATKFVEPENIDELNRVVMKYFGFALLLFMALTLLTCLIRDEGILDALNFSGWAGLGGVLFLITIPLHELLHAICFGYDATVDIYLTTKIFMAFSTNPVSKRRFIFLSLFPNIILGWLPFVIWAFIGHDSIVSGALYIYTGFNILAGCGDYMNVHNALTQMPAGSVQQLSGFNSYWYFKKS